jgi:hypothetical protein
MKRQHQCPGISRPSFLADTGMGFTGFSLASVLFNHNEFVTVR